MGAKYLQSAATQGTAAHRAVETIERVHRHPAAAWLSPRQRNDLAAAVAIRLHAEEWWARRGVRLAPIERDEKATPLA